MTTENYTMYSIKTPQMNTCLYLWEIPKLHKDGKVTRDILSKTRGYDTTHCQKQQQSGYVYSKTSVQYLTTTHVKEITVSHIQLHVILQPYQEVCMYMLSKHCMNKTVICNTTPTQAQYILYISIHKILWWPHHNALESLPTVGLTVVRDVYDRVPFPSSSVSMKTRW